MTHVIFVKSNLNVQIIDTRENVCFLIKLLVVYFDQRTGAPLASQNQFFNAKTTFCILFNQ